jgi:hypothetical protein
LKACPENEKEWVFATNFIPMGAQLFVDEGNQISERLPFAKASHSTQKTESIPNDLPRVAALLEACRPKQAAEAPKINGVVSFGDPGGALSPGPGYHFFLANKRSTWH